MEIPAPPFELVQGMLVRVRPASSSPVALLMAPDSAIPDLPTGMKTLYHGSITLRYGAAYLFRPVESLIPAWVYDDFQQEYKGFDVLRFLTEKGERFPRADVVGWRADSGTRDDRYVKELDMARPYRVFAYRSPVEQTPIHQVAVVGLLSEGKADLVPLEGAEWVSEWLRGAVPVYGLDAAHLVEFPAIVDPVEQD